MRKIATILVLCAVVLTAGFLGIRQLGQTKKTINVSVTDLSNEESDAPAQPADNVSEKMQESAVGDDQQVKEETPPVVSGKNLPAKNEPIVEEKKDTTSADTKAAASQGKIVQKLISWGFTKASDRKIDTVVVHTSYNSLGGDEYDANKIIDIYKQYEVSAHYLILRDGTIYQLVADQNIAWHAGVSEMPDGRKNVNDFSIGVEVINTKDGKFTDAQYSALNSLIAGLQKKYEIKYILGHDEIAPGRKTDPWGIDWKKVNR